MLGANSLVRVGDHQRVLSQGDVSLVNTTLYHLVPLCLRATFLFLLQRITPDMSKRYLVNHQTMKSGLACNRSK